jgi:hypothetical protein
LPTCAIPPERGISRTCTRRLNLYRLL